MKASMASSCSLHGYGRNICSVLNFVLWTFVCVNWNFDACASVWLCLEPITIPRIILRALRELPSGLPDDGTYEVSKHVRRLLTSDVSIFWCMLSWFYYIQFEQPLHNINILITYNYIWFAPTCFEVNTSSSGNSSCLAKITWIVGLDKT